MLNECVLWHIATHILPGDLLWLPAHFLRGTSWWSCGFLSYSTDLSDACFLSVEGKVNTTEVPAAGSQTPCSKTSFQTRHRLICTSGSTLSTVRCYHFSFFQFLIPDGSKEWNHRSLQLWYTSCYVQVSVFPKWKPIFNYMVWRLLCRAKLSSMSDCVHSCCEELTQGQIHRTLLLLSPKFSSVCRVRIAGSDLGADLIILAHLKMNLLLQRKPRRGSTNINNRVSLCVHLLQQRSNALCCPSRGLSMW